VPEVKVLAVGDVVGHPGRRAVTKLLPEMVKREGIAFVVCNAENSAGGSGITPATVAELLAAGCQCLTTGDHVYKNREALAILDKEPRLVRPANFPKRAAGKGWTVLETAVSGLEFLVPGSQPETRNQKPETCRFAVLNLLGRSFMGAPADNPFERAEELVAEIGKSAPDALLLVDFHAEASAEKIAMGRLLDGRAVAVWGTHTHVQTADECVLPGGTGCVTDIGMTGAHDSIIGRKAGQVLATLVTGMPERWEVADGDVRLSGAIFTIDPAARRCLAVKRVQVAAG
jgi:hypothetical protein